MLLGRSLQKQIYERGPGVIFKGFKKSHKRYSPLGYPVSALQQALLIRQIEEGPSADQDR